MRSDQHRRRIKNDRGDDYRGDDFSHTTYTSIPDQDMATMEASRFATVLYVWLALLIAAALIGYSLRSFHTTPSNNTPKPNVRQAPI
jgi:hypothetical protein